MNTPNLIWLIVMGLVGVVWAVEMFRMLFRIWRRANLKRDETGGGYFSWAGHSLAGYPWFFKSPETRAHRNRVLLLTAVMVLVVIVRPMVLIWTG